MNKKVHGGDAAVDALLYTDGARSDTNIFISLYGVKPEMAIQLHDAGCSYALKVLNYVATARAEDHLIIGLSVVQKAFSNFVDALENDRPMPLMRRHQESETPTIVFGNR